MEESIQHFWEWFEENEPTLIKAITGQQKADHTSLVNTIDNLVLSFGRLGWELGHGKSKPYFLTISPNNDKELLAITKQIISAAPSLNEWELNHAKQPIEWDFKFEVFDDNFEEHTIDASIWHQVLEQRSDGRINLMLKAENLNILDEESKMRSADMVVTSVLGEELRIQKINKIKLVDDFETSLQIKQAPIHILRKQVIGFDEK